MYLTKNEKNDELLMDMLRKSDNESRNKCRGAIYAFMTRPAEMQKKMIQAVGVSTDLPIMTKDSFNMTMESDNFDMGWEQAFRQVTVGKGQDSWEIANVANSLTFTKVQEGQKIEVAGITGTKTTAYVDYYGGALGWTDAMVRFRKLAMMVQMAEIFRNEFWVNKGNIHYALLAAAAALNTVIWQGVATDAQTTRDILTINQVAFNLTNGLKDKGYGDMASAGLIMYANPFDEDRVEAAFRVTSNALVSGANKGQQITSRRIKRIYTYNSNITAGNPIIVLPGQKSQKADVMNPTVFNQEVDILSLNYVQAVWAIYGAIVADTDQCYNFVLG